MWACLTWCEKMVRRKLEAISISEDRIGSLFAARSQRTAWRHWHELLQCSAQLFGSTTRKHGGEGLYHKVPNSASDVSFFAVEHFLQGLQSSSLCEDIRCSYFGSAVSDPATTEELPDSWPAGRCFAAWEGFTFHAVQVVEVNGWNLELGKIAQDQVLWLLWFMIDKIWQTSETRECQISYDQVMFFLTSLSLSEVPSIHRSRWSPSV